MHAQAQCWKGSSNHETAILRYSKLQSARGMCSIELWFSLVINKIQLAFLHQIKTSPASRMGESSGCNIKDHQRPPSTSPMAIKSHLLILFEIQFSVGAVLYNEDPLHWTSCCRCTGGFLSGHAQDTPAREKAVYTPNLS